MKVTANTLLNYIRCRRYASLNDPDFDSYRQDFPDSNDSLYHEYRQLFLNLCLNQESELTLNTFLSYDFHPDITLTETYDFIISEGDRETIYTLIPMTSKELLRQKYKLDKHKYQLFTKNQDGAYGMSQVDLKDQSSNYDEKIKKLTNRSDDLGRIVYTYAFRRYLYDIVNPENKDRMYYVFLNSDYVYDGHEYQPNLFHIFDFSVLYEHMKDIIDADLYRMINHLELDDFTACPLVKKECRKGDTYECKFVDFCFSHIPKTNSILDYFQSHLGFEEPADEGDIHHDTYELINNGIVDMLDIPISWLKDEKHLMQRYCVESDYVHVHKEKIEAMLKTLRYPLIYLDFEALPCLLPRYKGEQPYTQSVFQYSIHIEKTEGQLEKNGKDHFEFISRPEYDNRRELVESMINIVNAYDSSIIVYHKTFEEQRLKELQLVFPEYRNELQSMIDRLFDLKEVLKNDKKFYIQHGFSDYEASRYNFYAAELSGSYSLKKVIKVFDKKAYDDLVIKDGVEAYKTFLRLERQVPTDRDASINNLLEYCKQDTYSMFQIIQGLRPYLSPDFHIT